MFSAVHATICYIWTGLEVDISETKSPKYTQPKDHKPVFFCVLGGWIHFLKILNIYIKLSSFMYSSVSFLSDIDKGVHEQNKIS